MSFERDYSRVLATFMLKNISNILCVARFIYDNWASCYVSIKLRSISQFQFLRNTVFFSTRLALRGWRMTVMAGEGRDRMLHMFIAPNFVLFLLLSW